MFVSILLFQMTISQLKAELEKGPQEAAVYTQQIHQLQSNLNNVQQQSQVMCTPLEVKPLQLYSYFIILNRLLQTQICLQWHLQSNVKDCIAFTFTLVMLTSMFSCPFEYSLYRGGVGGLCHANALIWAEIESQVM